MQSRQRLHLYYLLVEVVEWIDAAGGGALWLQTYWSAARDVISNKSHVFLWHSAVNLRIFIDPYVIGRGWALRDRGKDSGPSAATAFAGI